ncbi:MAG TPA: hypothetical protein VF590_20640 [Isosphaeraceae bacterium]
MIGPILVALLPALTLALALAPDPAALTLRLGSPRFSERQEAAAALEALGDGALPALREARESRDPEIRSRAAALADAIERRRLVLPSLVTLDFRDRPLEEVIAALGARSGIPLRLAPADIPARRPPRITLEEPQPVPFWVALDRLCRAGGLQSSPVSSTLFGGPVGPPSILLQPGPPPRFTFNSGPFRVRAVGFHHRRDLMLDPEPGGPEHPALDEQFSLQVQVLVEPRCWIRQAGPVAGLVAADDQGRSLVPGPGDRPGDPPPEGAFDGSGQESVLPLTIALRHPGQVGRAIKTLRGRVPVVVWTRRGDPLAIPLAGASGKTFRGAGIGLEVHSVRDDPNLGRTTIELLLGTDGAPGEAGGAARGGEWTPQALENRIEVIDSQGRVVPLFLEGVATEEAGARVTLALMSDGGGGAGLGSPAQLRVFGLIEAPAEVPFEFSDLPTP